VANRDWRNHDLTITWSILQLNQVVQCGHFLALALRLLMMKEKQLVMVAVVYLVLTEPWPSMMRGIWKEPERYKDTYWSRFNNLYFAGDGANVR